MAAFSLFWVKNHNWKAFGLSCCQTTASFIQEVRKHRFQRRLKSLVVLKTYGFVWRHLVSSDHSSQKLSTPRTFIVKTTAWAFTPIKITVSKQRCQAHATRCSFVSFGKNWYSCIKKIKKQNIYTKFFGDKRSKVHPILLREFFLDKF